MEQKSKKIIFLIILVIATIIGFSTCVRAEGETFKITKEIEEVYLNGTTSLYCSGVGLSDTVTWKSSDESIAAVDSDGKVTGKAIGEATITATCNGQSATCKVNVIYYALSSVSNGRNRLVIGVYDSETLVVKAMDADNKEVSNPSLKWESKNSSVVTVDSNGMVKAIGVGETKVVVTAPGVTKEFEFKVSKFSGFTDFSKAKYEIKYNYCNASLNITNVTLDKNKKSDFYYIITSKKEKPTYKTINGKFDSKENENWRWLGYYQSEELVKDIAEYVELNQDLYLWIVENVYLDDGYYNGNNSIFDEAGFVVEGVKLTRPAYPVYAELFNATFISDDMDQLVFFAPWGETTERKFNIKIGEITDTDILNGIKNNKGDAWNSLLQYAKKSNAIYNNKLTTNSKLQYQYGSSFIEYTTKKDLINLKGLKDKRYYYMYIVFDDENGKYYPISGLTIAKGWVDSDNGSNWGLFFLGNADFKWDDFKTAQKGATTVDTKKVTTTSSDSSKPKSLPKTGAQVIVVGMLIISITGLVYFKIKNDKYKGI